MSFYSEMADTATGLITEFGAILEYKSLTAGAYSVSSSSAAKSFVTYQAKAVVLDFPIKEVDGSLILEADKRVIMAVGSGVVPKVGDVIKIAGIDRTVLKVKPISPAGIDVVYGLHVR